MEVAAHIQPARAESVLEVYLLGTVAFESALALQRRLVYQVSGAPQSGALLVCEHPPLITVGRQGSRAHIQCEFAELHARQWPVRWVNRGGGCLLHLPGQLAIYPVISLEFCKLGLQGYLEKLQSVLAAVLDDFSVRAHVRPGKVGLWVGNRPIASIGVAVRDWVAYYGAVLNVSPALGMFRLVRTGRAEDGPMTSLERERHGPVRPAMVRERLVEHFASHFPFARTSLFLEHPALRRKAPADALPTRS